MRQIDDHALLAELAKMLDRIAAELNNEDNVPRRYDGSMFDVAASADVDALKNASNVLARLGRWAKLPEPWPERYFAHSYIAPVQSEPIAEPILRVIEDMRKPW